MSLTYHLCCVCGTVSLERDWTYWQHNPDEAAEEETPWVPSQPGQSDPMALCPACKWEHRDIDDGSGFYEGTLAEMEAQREADLPEYGEWWSERLREVAA